jgi:PAS domain-containing protein
MTRKFETGILAVGLIVVMLGFAMIALSGIQTARVTEQLETITAITNKVGDVEATYYVVNDRGECQFATTGMARLIGTARASLIGKNMHDLIHHTHANGTPYPIAECEMFRAMRQRTVTRASDDTVWAVDGTAIPCEWLSEPFEVLGQDFTRITIFPTASEKR